ncbi:serine protease [Pigmentiphaga sp. NML080357]|uniref:NfeD family protein n=1 Tax=Pigmentiphaga sp. NML080357 TaxID=2008675 RepID=UPI000B410E30|nr:nodulation protein NfeD [Pigmentiphaga sp. NML080357]OVZ55049.1 serine protease [Pigmentiphaga sp. NML080357]
MRVQDVHNQRNKQALRQATGLLAAFVMLLSVSMAAPSQEPAATPRSVILLDVQGAIGPATTGYLQHGFETAARRKANAIVLRIDTPGGLATSMRDIIRLMLASPIPILAYVAPSGAQAASAGTYLLYASHLAAMAPGTNTGAATPVNMGGSPGEDAPSRDGKGPEGNGTKDAHGKVPAAEEPGAADAMRRKAVNDAVAFIRSLADMHGRNADWAEEAVRQSASIPAREARDRNVIELVAADLDDLLAQADGRRVKVNGKEVGLETRGAEVVPVEPNWRTRFLAIITNPNIAYILMLLGIYGIIFELMSPGSVFPGVLGAVALVVGLFALNLLPINYAGIGLVLLGIGLMAAEAVTPTVGLLGIGGVAIFALGSLFMFDGDIPGFQLSLPVVIAAAAASGLLLAVVLASVVRAHRRRVVTGANGLIGKSGTVLSWSGDSGQVRIHGESWRARSDRPLAPGTGVEVTGRDGLTLIVRAQAPTAG